MLNNRLHTSDDLDYLKSVCPAYPGEKFYMNKAAVTDNNLITASCVAPVEFCYEIIKSLHVFDEQALEAWYNLYTFKEPKYFYALMQSLES